MDRKEVLMNEFEWTAENIADFIFAEGNPDKADVIFVPGNGYPDMAEKAADLYHREFAPVVIPSGQYSITLGHFGGVLKEKDRYNGNYETEFDFLQDVLIKNGVPESAILREDRATYTYENALFSKDAAEKNGLKIKKALLCCKNYHAGRALMYYQTVFPDAEIIVCPVQVDGITKENWRTTEQGIREVMLEMRRIIIQFSLWM